MQSPWTQPDSLCRSRPPARCLPASPTSDPLSLPGFSAGCREDRHGFESQPRHLFGAQELKAGDGREVPLVACSQLLPHPALIQGPPRLSGCTH